MAAATVATVAEAREEAAREVVVVRVVAAWAVARAPESYEIERSAKEPSARRTCTRLRTVLSFS
jgi:hypothetical protein